MTVDEAIKELQRYANKKEISNAPRFFMSEVAKLMKQQQAEIEQLKAQQPNCNMAEKIGAGCCGYQKSEYNDEPIEQCERCKKYCENLKESDINENNINH